jgi:hypothetical protein
MALARRNKSRHTPAFGLPARAGTPPLGRDTLRGAGEAHRGLPERALIRFDVEILTVPGDPRSGPSTAGQDQWLCPGVAVHATLWSAAQRRPTEGRN